MTELNTLNRLLDAAIGNGWTVSVHDGGEWAVKLSTNRAAIVDAATSTCETSLRFRDASKASVGTMLLIWGNAKDGSELIADHSDNDAMGALAERAYA